MRYSYKLTIPTGYTKSQKSQGECFIRIPNPEMEGEELRRKLAKKLRLPLKYVTAVNDEEFEEVLKVDVLKDLPKQLTLF